MKWRTMDDAPRDGTVVLVWCQHDADPDHEPEPSTHLTPYGAWCEGGLGRAADGYQVARWGGGYYDSNAPDGPPEEMPDWWMVEVGDGDDPVPANPVRWAPLPAAPAD